ncbi:MAG: glycosyltransferase family protein [Sulfurihydrogenibium sp.]|uniref:glycosyltransferase family protein n=1 Tax=Sulfurihydrogenibium sp. TaxID=2053621 RepID=UPI003C7DD74F
MEEVKITKPRVVFLKTPDPRQMSESILEGLAKSLSARNFEVKIIELTAENVQDVINQIIEYKPLFTFDLNLDGMIYAEREGQQQPFCDILGNIHISWFIDDPMIHFTKLKPVLQSNQILYATIDIEHTQWLRSAGKNVAFIPPGVNPSKIPPLKEKEFEIAFVGPVTDPNIIESQWQERFDPNLLGFAVELGRMIYRNPDMPIRFAAGYLISQLNPDFQAALIQFQQENETDFMALLTEIGLYAMYLRRWSIIDSIENYEVNVLGPVIGEPKENVVVYEDVVSQKDIIDFLSRSKIALLSQPPFIPSGLGFTVFDSVASGSLTFVEDRLSSKSFFTPEKEIITYHPIDFIEIEGKVAYYLEEAQEEMKEIARAGRERALKEHTIYQRGEILASIMEDIIKQSLQEEQKPDKQEE